MRVWLTTISEPLPIDGKGDRTLRVGLLAEALVRRGHEVLWWTSTFYHMRKQQRFDRDRCIEVGESYRLRLLHACGYKSNVSVARILDHKAIARKFARLAPDEAPPDVIVSSFPVPWVCAAAARYARQRNIPLVIDVRDMWPEAFRRLAPRCLRPLADVALYPMLRLVRSVFSQATAVTGITPVFVDWGVRQGGLQRTGLDREFPLAYPEAAPAETEQAEGRAFWDARGLGEAPGAFPACFFGTIGRQFELETVIKAARLLKDDPGGFRFVLCGSGDALGRYQRQAEGLQNVLFPGWVGPAQIWALMARASVGLAPYHSNEDFRASIPNKAIEYLSGGLPIVSSLQGMLAELLAERECGLTYGNNDPNGLAECLRQLRADPTRLQAMSRNARRVFKERFVAEKVFDEWVDYLEEMARARPARPR